MIQPDFESIDRGIEQALKSIPEKVTGDRDLWRLRYELHRLQLAARRLKLRGVRAKQIVAKLSRRNTRRSSEAK